MNEPGTLRVDETALLAFINEGELTDWLRDLVRIPTVNPPGDVRSAVDYCARLLNAAGFHTEIVALDPTKPNLIATFGSAEGPVLCFNSHLDVVPAGYPAAWTHQPFEGEIIDGRLFGRGALDDKASVVAQLGAAIALARSERPIYGQLVVNFVADEEIGGPNGAALIVNERHIVPDAVIVGEPTSNRICLGERGGGSIVIETHGRTAHAALPWEGANAIEAIAEVITALRRELLPRLRERVNPFFAHSSAAFTMLEGGVKDNVVPDRARVLIDRRFIPGDLPDEALAEVRGIAECAVASVPGTSVEVNFAGEVGLARMIAPDAPLVAAMQNANAKLGGDPTLRGFSMATDGRFFAAAGYPTIIFGPGDPRLAHVPDESIGLDELLHATRVYVLTAAQVLGSN